MNVRSAAMSLCLGLLTLAGVPWTGGCRSPEATGKRQKPLVAAILMQEDQFFRLNEIGMRAAAKANGVELLVANCYGSLDKEIRLVDTYASRKVDAIIVSPISIKGSVTALKRARDAGIKVITYNGVVEGDIADFVVWSDQVALGRSTGAAAREYIARKLGGKAKIALIEFVSQSLDVGPLRPNGFKEEIRKLPGVEIVAEQDAWMPDQAERVVANILIAHPDVNVVWSANEGGTVGSVIAVKNAGKAGKVVVFGTDISDQLAGFLLSGDNILRAVTAQRPYEMGFTAVESAAKVLKGERIERMKVLAGELFSRDKPDEVKAYRARLQRMAK